MKKKLGIISNISFIGAMVVGLYALMSTYLVRRNLPPGVCPIDNNRTIMYIAIALALLSFVLSFVAEKKKS